MFANNQHPAHPEPVEEPQSLADIVREETDDGRLIVRFLVNLMQGNLENAKPCHRLDAARQLISFGFAPAQAFIANNSPQSSRRLPPSPSGRGAGGEGVSPDLLHHDLATLICEETDHGRTAVRFLVDVMQGNLPDFKPHLRLSAARELLRRGFDAPVSEDEAEAEYDDCPRRRYNDLDGIYYRGIDGKWHRDNVRSPTPDPRPIACLQAARPAPVPEQSENHNCHQEEYGPSSHWSGDEAENRLQHHGACSPKPDSGSGQAESPAAQAAMDCQSQATPHLLGHPAGNSGADDDTAIPPSDDGPGQARISLDGLGLGGIDSLSPDHYLCVGDMWQSVRPTFALIPGPSPPIPISPSP